MPREPLFPSLRYEVDRLFDTLVHTAWGDARETATWKPPCDVVEEPDRYCVEVDLPGVRSDDLSITAEGRTLRIEGVRRRLRSGGAEHRHVAERVCGRFARSFHLPEDADPAGIQARLDDGVLTVDIPRHPARRPR